MLRVLFLFFYSKRGYWGGLFVGSGFLVVLLSMFLMGGIFISEDIMGEAGWFSEVLDMSGDMSRSEWQLLLLLLLGCCVLVCVGGIASFYRGWVAKFNKMSVQDQNLIVDRGRLLVNVALVTGVEFVLGALLLVL